MVVAADRDLRRSLELGLEHMGHLVLLASRADQVAGILGGFVVDLVLCDHDLPDGDATDVLHAVNAAAPGVPTILMSDDLSTRLVATSLAEGFAACLSKPLDTRRLRRALWQAVGQPC